MAFINTLYNLWPSGDKLIPGLRDAMAATVVYWPRCNAGMTLLKPIDAVLRTPQRSFLDMRTMILASPPSGNYSAISQLKSQ